MTFEVQQNRWDQLVRRASGSIGPGSRVGETLSELFPVLDVENVPVELMLLSGWRLGMGTANLPASAADLNQIQLFNPEDSGHLVVPTHVLLHNAGTTRQFIESNFSTTALADNVGNVVFRDTRLGVASGTVTQVRTVQQPGGLPSIWQVIVSPNENFILENLNGLCVLAPGTGYNWANTVINEQFAVSFLFRERVALESELQF